MISPQDLARAPVFAGVPMAALAKIAESAADITANPGEYIVHEGDRPALFVVISGQLDITKLLDGGERVVTVRTEGQIYGEVPATYGADFQTSARAATLPTAGPSRVARIEMPDYYALAAVSPSFVAAVGALAIERMGGLQTLAREAPKPRGTLIAGEWDSTAAPLRRLLSRNQVPFVTEAPDGQASDVLPAFRLPDGTMLARPSPRALAEQLGLPTRPALAAYDVAIVGAGPAGLAAAVYGASEGLTTLVIEREAPGGQAGTSSRIENYLGVPGGISGDELAGRALRQARRLGAEIIVTRRALGIDAATRTIALDGGDSIRARSIILAMGVDWRRLDVPGLAALTGKGVFYGASRSDAATTQNRDVHLVGGGNSAGQAALFFASHASSVTLIVRGGDIADSMSAYLVEQIRAKANIAVMTGAEIRAVYGNESLTGIDIADRESGAMRQVASGGLFLFIGAEAETAWLPPEVARNERGYVLTGGEVVRTGQWSLPRDPYLVETSAPGIFACGDVRLSPVKRVAAAVGEGSMAIAFVHQYLAGEAGQG